MKGYLGWIAIAAALSLVLGCGQTSKKAAPGEAAKESPAKSVAPQTPSPAPASKSEPAQPATQKAQPSTETPQAKPEPSETKPPQPKKPESIGEVIQGTGKLIGDAGKAVIEGGGKVLDGAGKMVVEGGGKLIEGGGKVLASTGEAISGAGVAIGKAVGDVMETAFAPGTKAPDFNLRDLDGRPIALADLKGSPVVMVFCTTNYPPCVVELRHLRDLQAKYEADNLKVIAIALDWEGPAVLRRFQQEMALNYPILWDNGEVFKSYTASSNVPTTFFIDKNGNIMKKRMGFASATIVTQGSNMVGTSMVELDPGFEKDLVELLKK